MRCDICPKTPDILSYFVHPLCFSYPFDQHENDLLDPFHRKTIKFAPMNFRLASEKKMQR